MSTLQIQIPNTNQTLSGLLIGVDKTTMRFVARIDECLECLRVNMTAQAMLTIGGTPRRLSIQITDINGSVLTFTPISAAMLYERRERKRYSVNLQAQIRYGESSLLVKVVNISVSGLGLHTPQALEIGQTFEIESALVGADQPLQATAQVRHCRPLDGGRWYIGAAFVDLNRADSLWLRKLFP